MMTASRKRTVTATYLALGALVAIGLGLGIVRLINGMGNTTSLNDAYPWGLWIVYDIFFVPVSAGAFMILTITHIYHREEYHNLTRPVVLAGFLGEVMVIAVLLMDLGRWNQFYNVLFPWNWNIRSFMFQVSICLTIYMGVMVLEVAPSILERLNWQAPLRLIRMATAVIAGLGIILSSLHQSALGSLFLLMPYKLHPLWWTPALPLLSFVASTFSGLAMAILVVLISFKAFRRPLDIRLLSTLARIAAVLLGFYLVLRIGDLVLAGELGLLFTEGTLSVLCWAEIVLGAVIPIALFAMRKYREKPGGLVLGSGLILAGIALNRTNLALIAYEAPGGATYFPHWIEIVISLAAVAAGILLFAIAATFLPILPQSKGGEKKAVELPWSRRAIIFAAGVLTLLTVTVVLTLLPVTQAEAKLQSSAPAVGGYALPPVGECQNCHQNAEALASAGVDASQASVMLIEPRSPETPHGRLYCVSCHYGDRDAADPDSAHRGMVVDPSQENAQVCLACHPDLPDEFPDDRLRTAHDDVVHGTAADVYCSDCHGAAGHGFDPVSHDMICSMSVCLDCHIERNLDSELCGCGACHMTPHDPEPAQKCCDCHQSTDDWHQVGVTDHPLPLEGQHAQVDCASCHDQIGESKGIMCADCHLPPEEPHYGNQCEDCHVPSSFQEATLPAELHPVALKGAHQTASCDGCHANEDALTEFLCSNCHPRPENHLRGECGICHTPSGWAQSINWLVQLVPAVSHGTEGREECLTCHDPESDMLPAPANHNVYTDQQCTLCHKAE